MENILEIRDISKSYKGNRVLNNISLSIKRGSIHGLVGTNGSGKSTLLNILVGNHIIKDSGGYTGELHWCGRIYNPFSSSMRSRIGMVHQEFINLPHMTVWENILIDDERVSWRMEKFLGCELSPVDVAECIEECKALLSSLEIELDPEASMRDLSTGMKQFIEIMREVRKKHVELMILDEPTAVLTSDEAGLLMKILKKLAQRGMTIFFVSHKLQEVIDLCEEVTILRDGDLIETCSTDDIDMTYIEEHMTGFRVKEARLRERSIPYDPIMSLSGLSVDLPGDPGRDIDLHIHRGEILGITGISGHGKLSLGYGIGGLSPVSGEIHYEGEVFNPYDIEDNIRKGVVVITEDRKNTSLLISNSLRDNIAFSANTINRSYLRGGIPGWLGLWDYNKIHRVTAGYIEDLQIRCSSPLQPAGELSGGNQQKLCISRAMAMNPRLLYVGEPTRGIDIAAKELVLSKLVELNREKGTTIIISSSEVKELERVCDRIVTFYEGSVSHEILPGIRCTTNTKEEVYA